MSTPTGAGSSTRRRFGALAAGAVLLPALLSGCSTAPAPAPSATEDAYGALPSWLPTDATTGGVLTADVRHPALASEGDQVAVHLAAGTVRMTVVGPEVPGEGLPVRTEDTTCTWTVTISGASAPIRLRAADFATVDRFGTVYRLVPVPGSPAIPTRILPGRTVRLLLRTAMPTGEGVLQYSGGTTHVLAGWDFVVEND